MEQCLSTLQPASDGGRKWSYHNYSNSSSDVNTMQAMSCHAGSLPPADSTLLISSPCGCYFFYRPEQQLEQRIQRGGLVGFPGCQVSGGLQERMSGQHMDARSARKCQVSKQVPGQQNKMPGQPRPASRPAPHLSCNAVAAHAGGSRQDAHRAHNQRTSSRC